MQRVACVLAETVLPCARHGCPFWEPGGAVLPPGCSLTRLLPPEQWTAGQRARWRDVRRLAGRCGYALRWPDDAASGRPA